MFKRLLAVLWGISAFAVQAEGTRFEKDNAVLDMAMTQGTIQFTLNAVEGQSACEAQGTAKIIDDHRAAYTSNDSADRCVILFNFETADQIKVTTKDCNRYCGLAAVGAMDGSYTKR
jgi:hypothetical protein